MALPSAIRAGRRRAARMMRSTGRIDSLGTPTVDANGSVTAAPTKRYEGPMQVSSWEPHEQSAQGGDHTTTVQRYVIKVPVGALQPSPLTGPFKPEIGHVATIATNPDDAGLVGRKFRVVALLHKTSASSYRLMVEETVA